MRKSKHISIQIRKDGKMIGLGRRIVMMRLNNIMRNNLLEGCEFFKLALKILKLMKGRKYGQVMTFLHVDYRYS